jgi:hypothetical protein
MAAILIKGIERQTIGLRLDVKLRLPLLVAVFFHGKLAMLEI